MIYFIHVKTDKIVHAQSLGPTDSLFYYAEADNETEAGEMACDYLKKRYALNSTVRTVSKATKQKPEEYCFQEQILK